jgi:anthranilate synthase component 2
MASHLVVDNYDSFTYNLVHILEDILQDDLDVLRVDEVDVESLVNYDSVILSPGPGLPDESKNLMPIVENLLTLKKKTLGVCLGMQALALATGMKLKNLNDAHHGVSHELINPSLSARLYRDLESPLMVGRYHSWVVDETSMKDDWLVTAKDAQGEIMSMEHSNAKLFAIQYHPESVLTPQGRKILANYLAA